MERLPQDDREKATAETVATMRHSGRDNVPYNYAIGTASDVLRARESVTRALSMKGRASQS